MLYESNETIHIKNIALSSVHRGKTVNNKYREQGKREDGEVKEEGVLKKEP